MLLPVPGLLWTPCSYSASLSSFVGTDVVQQWQYLWSWLIWLLKYKLTETCAAGLHVNSITQWSCNMNDTFWECPQTFCCLHIDMLILTYWKKTDDDRIIHVNQQKVFLPTKLSDSDISFSVNKKFCSRIIVISLSSVWCSYIWCRLLNPFKALNN